MLHKSFMRANALPRKGRNVCVCIYCPHDSCRLTMPFQDDVADFVEVLKGFEFMGMDASTAESVLSLVGGVLLLGNVRIEGEPNDGLPDAATICKDDKKDFEASLQKAYL